MRAQKLPRLGIPIQKKCMRNSSSEAALALCPNPCRAHVQVDTPLTAPCSSDSAVDSSPGSKACVNEGHVQSRLSAPQRHMHALPGSAKALVAGAGANGRKAGSAAKLARLFRHGSSLACTCLAVHKAACLLRDPSGAPASGKAQRLEAPCCCSPAHHRQRGPGGLPAPFWAVAPQDSSS